MRPRHPPEMERTAAPWTPSSSGPAPRRQRHPPTQRGAVTLKRSWRDLRGDPCTARKPVAIGSERQPELFVIDPEIAVCPARHRIRPDGLHLLRDDADISLVAPEIAEAIVAEAIIETAEQDDVVFQGKVGAPASAATTAAAASSAEAATAMKSAAPGADTRAPAGAGKARPAALGRRRRRTARRYIETASAAPRPVRCGSPIARSALLGPVARIALAIGGAGTVGAAAAIAAIAGAICGAIRATIS